MTFSQFVKENNLKMTYINTGRHRQRKLKRFLVKFFNENSTSPQKSIRYTQIFGICTIPGFVALCLAGYCAMNVENTKYALIGNLILFAINNVIFLCGKVHGKNEPINIATPKKKEKIEKIPIKNIIVYSLVGALFFGFLLFFMLGISSISRSNQGQTHYKSAISIQSELITILGEKGYETANVPTTYWSIDESKLEHIAAGEKENSKFEFYGYSDSETVDLVYNQIVYLTAPELDNSKREECETALSDKSKMFTVVADGIYYLVMYRNDTVVYAYSENSLSEINEILVEIGYLDKQ